MDVYLLERRPLAEQIVEAVRTLPREIAPEFWYEFEPNPKRNRLYLSVGFETYRALMLEHSAYGTLERSNQYAVNLSGFQGPKGEIGSNFLCAVTPRSKKNTPVDMRSLTAVAEHLINQGDIYCAYFEDWDAAQLLVPFRVDALLRQRPGSQISPFNVKTPRDYLSAKYTFPGFHWRTLLSDECITDYGIDMNHVANVVWRCEQKGPGGLWDMQLCETLEEWPDVWEWAFELTAKADAHRFEGELYRNLFDGTNKPHDPATWYAGHYLNGQL